MHRPFSGQEHAFTRNKSEKEGDTYRRFRKNMVDKRYGKMDEAMACWNEFDQQLHTARFYVELLR